MGKAMPKNLWIIFTICLTFISANSFSTTTQFYEQLTYPDSEWSSHDFGRLPSSSIKKLLQANKPTTYLDKKQCLPMDFYKQYLKFLRVLGKSDTEISRTWLKSHERDLSVKFKLSKQVHCISENTPPLYAYSWKENMQLADGTVQNIRVLKYSRVFFKSGLPTDMPLMSRLLTLGSHDIWHYLDLHGAIFYLLRDGEKQPFAMVLGQHNHFRSYLIGVDITREQSKDICYAIRSNEPYICQANETYERTTANPKDIDWVISGSKQPNFAGYDRVPGNNDGFKMTTRLEYLPSKDPLITSWINLGPNLRLFGMINSSFRDAPAGMAIYTTPKLKEVWKTAQYFYFDKDNKMIFEEHRENWKDFDRVTIEPVFSHNAKRFSKYYYSAKRRY